MAYKYIEEIPMSNLHPDCYFIINAEASQVSGTSKKITVRYALGFKNQQSLPMGNNGGDRWQVSFRMGSSTYYGNAITASQMVPYLAMDSDSSRPDDISVIGIRSQWLSRETTIAGTAGKPYSAAADYQVSVVDGNTVSTAITGHGSSSIPMGTTVAHMISINPRSNSSNKMGTKMWFSPYNSEAAGEAKLLIKSNVDIKDEWIFNVSGGLTPYPGDPNEWFYIGTVKSWDYDYYWIIADMANRTGGNTSGTFTIRCITMNDGEALGSFDENGKPVGLAMQTEVTLRVPTEISFTLKDNPATIGQENAITLTGGSQYYITKVYLSKVGGGNPDTLFDGLLRDVNGVIEWTPAYELAMPQIMPGTRATFELRIDSYTTFWTASNIEAALVGSNKQTIEIICPDNNITKPIIDSISIVPTGTLPEGFPNDVYIQRQRGVKVTVRASSEYSSIPTSGYDIQVGTTILNSNPAELQTIIESGAVLVTVKVTDARKFTRIETRTISVIPYSRPRIIPYPGQGQVICERALENDALDPEGTLLAIRAGMQYSNIKINDIERNSCILRYRFKPSNVPAYGEWTTLMTDNDGKISTLISGIVNSVNRSYDVELSAIDVFGAEDAHTLHFRITTKQVSFKLYPGPDGAAFGKQPEEPHVVDIAEHMKLRVRGEFIVDGGGWNSLGYFTSINDPTENVGRYTGCGYRVENGNHVYIAFSCSTIYGTARMRINDTAIPEELRPARGIYGIVPCDSRQIALIHVDTSGYIWVEWVQRQASATVTNNTTIQWIDGYIDYFTGG